jgi:hypothetical protein
MDRVVGDRDQPAEHLAVDQLGWPGEQRLEDRAERLDCRFADAAGDGVRARSEHVLDRVDRVQVDRLGALRCYERQQADRAKDDRRRRQQRAQADRPAALVRPRFGDWHASVHGDGVRQRCP